MAKRTLKVIPKPKEGTRSVLMLDPSAGTVVIQGDGQLDFLCGNCGAVLALQVEHAQIVSLVLYCNRCQNYNETPR